MLNILRNLCMNYRRFLCKPLPILILDLKGLRNLKDFLYLKTSSSSYYITWDTL